MFQLSLSNAVLIGWVSKHAITITKSYIKKVMYWSTDNNNDVEKLFESRKLLLPPICTKKWNTCYIQMPHSPFALLCFDQVTKLNWSTGGCVAKFNSIQMSCINWSCQSEMPKSGEPVYAHFPPSCANSYFLKRLTLILGVFMLILAI